MLRPVLSARRAAEWWRGCGPGDRHPLVVVLAVVVGCALATGAAAGLGLARSGPAGADPMSSCTTTTGVVVVVDFTSFDNGNPYDGSVAVGCAASATSGAAAMAATGFTPAGDEHDGPAFVCRIDNDPSPAQDPCVTTPPPNASWSYWHGDLGSNTWTYSTEGFMDYCPPPGSVDAWVFAGSPDAAPGNQPPHPPSAYRATTPGPPSSPDPCAGASTWGGGTPAAGASGSSAGTSGVAPSASPSTTSTSAVSAPPTSAPARSGPPATRPASTAGAGPGSPSKSAATSTSSSLPAGTRIVSAVPASTRRPKTSGSPWPLVGGLFAAFVLVAVGGVAASRRRRVSDPP